VLLGAKITYYPLIGQYNLHYKLNNGKKLFTVAILQIAVVN
jgi:hypothetical protein